jgi:hypothetical protein
VCKFNRYQAFSYKAHVATCHKGGHSFDALGAARQEYN